MNPDVVGSVLQMPFGDDSFDIVACYELLEHLPYGSISTALNEMCRVCWSYVVLSLPDATRAYRWYLQIPMIGVIKGAFSSPRRTGLAHVFDEQHYWEIGNSGYSLERVLRDVSKAGFKGSKTYGPLENPYHRFFVLRKTL
jgi:ubiquinone/menaquinone biosynthesis C-methylase UbiE